MKNYFQSASNMIYDQSTKAGLFDSKEVKPSEFTAYMQDPEKAEQVYDKLAESGGIDTNSFDKERFSHLFEPKSVVPRFEDSPNEGVNEANLQVAAQDTGPKWDGWFEHMPVVQEGIQIVATSVGNIIEGAGGFISRGANRSSMGGVSSAMALTGAALTKVGSDIQEEMEYDSVLAEFEWESLATSQGWKQMPRIVYEGTLQSLPYLVGGLGVGAVTRGVTGVGLRYGGPLVGKLAKSITPALEKTRRINRGLSGAARQKAAQEWTQTALLNMGGGLGQSLAIATVYTGTTYNELIELGIDEEIAAQESGQVFNDIMKGSLLNAVQFGHYAKALRTGKGAQRAISTMGVVGNVVGQGLQEIYEEGAVEAARERATGKSEMTAFQMFTNPEWYGSAAAAQSFIAGAGGAGGTSAGTAAVGRVYRKFRDNPTHQADNSVSQTKGEIDHAVSFLEEQLSSLEDSLNVKDENGQPVEAEGAADIRSKIGNGKQILNQLKSVQKEANRDPQIGDTVDFYDGSKTQSGVIERVGKDGVLSIRNDNGTVRLTRDYSRIMVTEPGSTGLDITTDVDGKAVSFQVGGGEVTGRVLRKTDKGNVMVEYVSNGETKVVRKSPEKLTPVMTQEQLDIADVSNIPSSQARLRKEGDTKEESKSIGNEPLVLVHYSRQEGLTKLSPDFEGTGTAGEASRQGKPAVPSTYFYKNGGKGERIVMSRADRMYTVKMDAPNLYDLGQDSGLDSFAKKAKEKNNGVFDRDVMLQMVKDAGYDGYHNSSMEGSYGDIVALFGEVKPGGEYGVNPADKRSRDVRIPEEAALMQKKAADITFGAQMSPKSKEATARMLNNLDNEPVLPPTAPKKERVNRFVKNAVQEVGVMLGFRGARESGLTWYKEDVQEAVAKAKEVFGNIDSKTDRNMFWLMTAVTSSGQNPIANMQSSYKVWKHSNYKASEFSSNWGKERQSFVLKNGKQAGTGRVVREGKTFLEFEVTDKYNRPELDNKGNVKLKKVQKKDLKEGYPAPTAFLNRPTALNDNFNRLVSLIEEKGSPEAAFQWLLEKHPVSELRKYRDTVPDSEGSRGKVTVKGEKYGAEILGDKLGPFFLNLNGIGETLTMDLWFSRSWNRYMKTLINDKNEIQDTPRTPVEATEMKEAVAKAAETIGLESSEFQAILWYFEQSLWTKSGNNSPSLNYVDGINAVADDIVTDPKKRAEVEGLAVDLTDAERRKGEAFEKSQQYDPADVRNIIEEITEGSDDRESFTIGVAPFRTRNISGVGDALNVIKKDKAYREFLEKTHELANELDLIVDRYEPTMGGWRDTESGEMVREVSLAPVVYGKAENIKLFSVLSAVMAPEVQNSVMLVRPDVDGNSSSYVVTLEKAKSKKGTEQNIDSTINDLAVFELDGFSFNPANNQLTINDLDGKLETKIAEYINEQHAQGRIKKRTEQAKADTEFIGEDGYREILESGDRAGGRDGGEARTDSNIFREALQKLDKYEASKMRQEIYGDMSSDTVLDSDQFEAVVTDFASEYAVEISLVTDEKSLPKYLRDQIDEAGQSGKIIGLYDPNSDTVHIINREGVTAKDLTKTLMHETMHFGLRRLGDSERAALLDDIYKSVIGRKSDDPTRQLLQRIERNYKDNRKSDAENNRLIAEELIAFMSESKTLQQDKTLTQKVLDAIRKFFGKIIADAKVEMTDGDILDIVSGIQTEFRAENGYTPSARQYAEMAARMQKKDSEQSAPQSIVKTLRELTDGLGLVMRQGGTYGKASRVNKKQPNVIRVESIGDVNPILAAVGKSLLQMNNLKISKKSQQYKQAREYAKDMMTQEKMDSLTANDLMKSIFGELFTTYVRNPIYISKNHPALFSSLEVLVDGDGVSETVGNARSAIQSYEAAPPAEKARVGVITNEDGGLKRGVMDASQDGSLSSGIKNWGSRIYTKLLDQYNPIGRATKELRERMMEQKGTRFDIAPSKDPYKLARLTADSYSRGQMDLSLGITPYGHTQPSGPSMTDALQKALGDDWGSDSVHDFGTYLVAKRLIPEWERYRNGELKNPPSKEPLGTWLAVQQDLEAKYPSFKDGSNLVYEWTTNLWKKTYDAGLINDALYNIGVEKSAYYTPVQRDLRDKAITPRSGKGKDGALGKKFEGSDRDIHNPIKTLMKMSFELNSRIAINDAVKSFSKILEGVKVSGDIGEFVPSTRLEKVLINPLDALQSLDDQFADSGLSAMDTVMELLEQSGVEKEDVASAAMYRSAMETPDGKRMAMWYEDGEVKAIQFNDDHFGLDLYEAFKNMDGSLREELPAIVNAIAKPAAILRAGITTETSFFFANMIRDQLAAWALTDVGYTPFVDFAKGVRSELSQDQFYAMYRNMSGVSSVVLEGLNKGNVDKSIARLKNKNVFVQNLGSLPNLRALAEITSLSESGTRIGLFRKAYKNALERGMTELDAATEAAYVTRDYIDFSRSGSSKSVQAARKTITFLNVGVQSLDKFYRRTSGEGQMSRQLKGVISGEQVAMTEAEQKQYRGALGTISKVMMLGLVGLSQSWYFRDDEEYDEINKDFVRGTHWTMKLGDGKWLTVPKPFELAVVSNILETAFDAAHQKDEEWGSKMLSSIWNITGVPMVPPGINVLYEAAANKNLQNGRDIVPQNLMNREIQDQWNQYTSGISKHLAPKIGISPMKMDHIIKGWTGSWGRLLLDSTRQLDETAPDPDWNDMYIVRRFVKDVNRGSESRNTIYDLAGRNGATLDAQFNSFRDRLDGQGREVASDYFSDLPEYAQQYIAERYRRLQINGSDKPSPPPMDTAYEGLKFVGDFNKLVIEDEKMPTASKRILLNATNEYATKMSRNALAASMVPGYTEKDIIDYPSLSKLQSEHPELYSFLMMNASSKGYLVDNRAAFTNYRESFISGGRANISDVWRSIPQ